MGFLKGWRYIILLGDFNAQIDNHETVFYDPLEMLRELEACDMKLDRCSQDEECTKYGRYLMEMGASHGLAILNGLQEFCAAANFTFFLHRHGARIVDYVMAQWSLMSCIQDFIVEPRHMGLVVDHTRLTFTISF